MPLSNSRPIQHHTCQGYVRSSSYTSRIKDNSYGWFDSRPSFPKQYHYHLPAALTYAHNMEATLLTGVSAAQAALSGYSTYLTYTAVSDTQSYADATTGVPDLSDVKTSRKQEEQSDKNSKGRSTALLGGDPLGVCCFLVYEARVKGTDASYV